VSREAQDRLLELETLSAGWLDGAGLPPALPALRNARALLVPPRLYPTPEGGVQAEWTIGSYEFAVTFEPDGSMSALLVETD